MLHPMPHWGSLQHSPRSSSCIFKGLLLRGEKGRGGDGEGGNKGGSGEERKGIVLGPPKNFGVAPLWSRDACELHILYF